MLNGSIDSVGGQYVITLEATNVASGDSLGRQQAQAERKEDVLNALHGAATKLRGQLGESLGHGAEVRHVSFHGHHFVARRAEGA